MKLFRGVALIVLLAVAFASAAYATSIPPGQTGVTPAGNTVTNTGTAPIEATATTVDGVEYVDVEGDGAVIHLTAPNSAAEVAGDGTRVHHDAEDTTSEVDGQPTTVVGATTTTVTTSVGGTTTTSSQR